MEPSNKNRLGLAVKEYSKKKYSKESVHLGGSLGGKGVALCVPADVVSNPKKKTKVKG